jgi:hypothetical protein
MSQSSVKAAAVLVLSSFLDVSAQDGVVLAAQVSARDYRSQAAIATHNAINVQKITTTTAVAAALSGAGEEISKDMRFTVNSAVGYFATAGWVLTLGGEESDDASIPENDTVARFMYDIKEVGQTRAKQIIRVKGQTTRGAYDLIRAEAQVIIDARKADKSASHGDAHYLRAASGPIGKALELVAAGQGTTDGLELAHALIAQLTAAYGAPVAVPSVPAQGGALASVA